MTREDLDAHGCKLADLWHEAGSEARDGRGGHHRADRKRSQVIDLAVTIGGGDPAIACYLGARIFDRLTYMGDRGAAQHWLDALERWAVTSTGG